MNTYKGYTIELRPTLAQQQQIAYQFKRVRDYWNVLLALSKYQYASNKVKEGKELDTYTRKHGIIKYEKEFYVNRLQGEYHDTTNYTKRLLVRMIATGASDRDMMRATGFKYEGTLHRALKRYGLED